MEERIEAPKSIPGKKLPNEQPGLLPLFSWAERTQDASYCYRLKPTPGLGYISPTIQYLTGYFAQEYFDDPDLFQRVLFSDDRLAIEKWQMADHEETIDSRWMRRDGASVHVEHRYWPVFDPQSGEVVAIEGMCRDTSLFFKISELCELEVADLLALVQNDRTALAMFTLLDERFILTNPAFCEMLEYGVDALINRYVDNVNIWVSEQDREYIINTLRDEQSVPSLKTVLRTRDEKILFVQLAAKRVSFQGTPAALVAVKDLSGFERVMRYFDQMQVISDLGRNLAQTFSLSEVYGRTAQGLLNLFPDVSTIYISRYDAESELIICAHAVQDGQMLDVSLFPAMQLEPPGKGLQSEVIHTRQPQIVKDLQKRITLVSKAVFVGSDGNFTRSAAYVPMIVKDEILGVIQVQSTLLDRFSAFDIHLMTLIANTTAVSLQNVTLIEDLQKSNRDLEIAYDATLEGWARALELRDQETEGHSRRVTDMVVQLGGLLGLPEEDLVRLRRGAQLHDIGKMGISDNILLKAGPLTEEEWVQMRMHPVYAKRMLEPIGELQSLIEIPYCHHERWDGKGYPQGLRGEEIPLHARIFSIIDVWDALCSDRPYRPKWSREGALGYIREQAGKQFDPKIMEAFLTLISLSEPKR